MFKNALFAVAALVVLVSSVRAEDGLLEGLDTSAIQDAQVEIQQPDLDGLDVDQLGAEAGSEESEDAIEACFRRFGYGGYGYGYGFRRYYSCYRPFYSYGYHHYHCYRPIVRVCRPVYYYWGCY